MMAFHIEFDSNSDIPSLTSSAYGIVRATYSVQIQVASALAWICAAVRYSSHNKIVHSPISISVDTNSPSSLGTVSIRLAILEQIATEEYCWHSLLPHAVIAKGSPIRSRVVGKGLEISFANIALLAQSMSFTEYDEGLIVEGLRSVLIPMKILPQDDAIQWHLEYKRQAEPPKRRRIFQIFETVPIHTWYKSQKPEELF
jgi:hypothetical protein